MASAFESFFHMPMTQEHCMAMLQLFFQGNPVVAASVDEIDP
jgi:hypothetical protein